MYPIFVKSHAMAFCGAICFTAAGTLFLNAQTTAPATSSPARAAASQAVVYTFAVAATPSPAVPTPSDNACPQDTDSTSDAETKPFDPQLLETINSELTTKLAKKMTVLAAPAPSEIGPGTLVFAGCLTRLDPGNAAKRMVGMNMGAGYLAAHVRVFTQTQTGLVAVQEFDVEVKSANMLPPLGPAGVAVHAVKGTRQTLNANGKKLADKIVKTFYENQKTLSS